MLNVTTDYYNAEAEQITDNNLPDMDIEFNIDDLTNYENAASTGWFDPLYFWCTAKTDSTGRVCPLNDQDGSCSVPNDIPTAVGMESVSTSSND